VTHLVPVEACLPDADVLTQEMELLRMKTPLLPGDLEGEALVGAEEPEIEALE